MRASQSPFLNATESYGIIYNKSLLKKYFDASWSTVKSAEDINNFKALKTVADEIQAHKDEIGVKGAFSSAGLDSSSAFRYNFHLPSVPLYYEYADDGVDMTKVPSSVKGTYVKKMKNIFDLYIKDSTVEPSSLSGKTMDDSIAEFATGQAVFFQDACGPTTRSRVNPCLTTIWECSPSTLAPRAKRTRV